LANKLCDLTIKMS